MPTDHSVPCVSSAPCSQKRVPSSDALCINCRVARHKATQALMDEILGNPPRTFIVKPDFSKLISLSTDSVSSPLSTHYFCVNNPSRPSRFPCNICLEVAKGPSDPLLLNHALSLPANYDEPHHLDLESLSLDDDSESKSSSTSVSDFIIL